MAITMRARCCSLRTIDTEGAVYFDRELQVFCIGLYVLAFRVLDICVLGRVCVFHVLLGCETDIFCLFHFHLIVFGLISVLHACSYLYTDTRKRK